MKKRGPKPKPPSEVRNIQFPVRITAQELDKYKKQATKEGKDLSRWTREVLDEKCDRG